MATFSRQQRLHELDRHNQQQTRRIQLETSVTDLPTTTTGATLAGDPRRLRGLPCLAKGVSGHIPGTRP